MKFTFSTMNSKFYMPNCYVEGPFIFLVVFFSFHILSMRQLNYSTYFSDSTNGHSSLFPLFKHHKEPPEIF